MKESVLEEAGRHAFEKYLATEIYPESRALVKAHQDAGHTVAIITSATRYQADPVAEELGIEHVLCTRLEVEDGVLTGGVIRPTCYGEGKADAARSLTAKYDLDLDQSYFYSDSHEDLPLFDIVGRPRPLNPTRRLAQIAKERQWPVRRFTSRGTPTVGDVVRTGLIYGALAPSVVFGLGAGLLNSSKREAFNVMGSVWGDVATSAAGIDLRVKGEEHLWSHRPAVFIFNHQSGLELVLLLKMLRRDFTGIAKEELRHNPVFGPLFSGGRRSLRRPYGHGESNRSAGAGSRGAQTGSFADHRAGRDALEDSVGRTLQEGSIPVGDASGSAHRTHRVSQRAGCASQGSSNRSTCGRRSRGASSD